jgi:2-oxoglutarate ferredoxin oxidoreductase subunit delta
MLEDSDMPSGDELPEPPADSKRSTRVKGTVVILSNRCKGCGFCVEFCPTSALEMSKDMNQKGYHFPDLASPDKCNGCDLCGMLCPDFAIYGFFEKNGRRKG